MGFCFLSEYSWPMLFVFEQWCSTGCGHVSVSPGFCVCVHFLCRMPHGWPLQGALASSVRFFQMKNSRVSYSSIFLVRSHTFSMWFKNSLELNAQQNYKFTSYISHWTSLSVQRMCLVWTGWFVTAGVWLWLSQWSLLLVSCVQRNTNLLYWRLCYPALLLIE